MWWIFNCWNVQMPFTVYRSKRLLKLRVAQNKKKLPGIGKDYFLMIEATGCRPTHIPTAIMKNTTKYMSCSMRRQWLHINAADRFINSYRFGIQCLWDWRASCLGDYLAATNLRPFERRSEQWAATALTETSIVEEFIAARSWLQWCTRNAVV